MSPCLETVCLATLFNPTSPKPVNLTVQLMPLDAEGLKIHWSVPRSMERSRNLKHFSAVCSWCVPAISLLGYRLGRGEWTSGKMAVHNTVLQLQEHLELTDIFSIFLVRISFHWGIPPASFLNFLDKIFSRYLQESLETHYHMFWEKCGKVLHSKDLSISYTIVCIFPSLLPAVTLGLVQDQSILTVLRNVLKMSLGHLLYVWPLESPTFWGSMSL